MRAEAGLAILLAGFLYAWWPPAEPERAWWLLAWTLFSTTALWLTRPGPKAKALPDRKAVAEPQVPLGVELAHDFRTPLTRLRLRLGAIADGQATDGDQLAAIESDLLQLERLADDFIDLTSASAAWPRGAEGPLDLTAAVAEEVERLMPLFDLQDRAVESYLSATKPVLCSPSRLARMLGNVLSNALRYAKGPGPVTVRLGMDGPLFVRLSVANPAFHPAVDLNTLVQPFVRGDPSSSAQGFGLGLAVVQRLAAVSGGRLRLGYDEKTGYFETVLLFPRAGSAGS